MSEGKKLKAESKTPEELANQWIAELTEAGYTHDEMFIVFRDARLKYDSYKNSKNKLEARNKRIKEFKGRMLANGYQPEANQSILPPGVN